MNLVYPFTVCSADGEARQHGHCAKELVSKQADGDEFVVAELVDMNTEYVDPLSRETMKKTAYPFAIAGLVIQADGLEIACIGPMPAGVRVVWPDGLQVPCGREAIEFATHEPGPYRFVFLGAKYLPQEVVIEARI